MGYIIGNLSTNSYLNLYAYNTTHFSPEEIFQHPLAPILDLVRQSKYHLGSH